VEVVDGGGLERLSPLSGRAIGDETAAAELLGLG
jgi:hypothetical protein